jgi:hypothetical protein
MKFSTLGFFQILSKLCGDIRSSRCTIGGVVDTDSIFAASIVDTGSNFATGINSTRGTGGKICRRFTLTCEYLREFFEKIRNDPYFNFMGLGEDDS